MKPELLLCIYYNLIDTRHPAAHRRAPGRQPHLGQQRGRAEKCLKYEANLTFSGDYHRFGLRARTSNHCVGPYPGDIHHFVITRKIRVITNVAFLTPAASGVCRRRIFAVKHASSSQATHDTVRRPAEHRPEALGASATTAGPKTDTSPKGRRA
ncbi:MAG: hypothetical protein ACJAVS_000342 [Paracoccaceae bacterium]|jgi:hypothetical protein